VAAGFAPVQGERPPIATIASTLGAVVAVVFAAAALSKLRAPGRFAEELGDYQILPRILLRPAAIAIPFAELVLGIGFFFPAFRSAASWAMALLLVVFSGAVLLNLQRGRRSIRCACFGRDDQVLGWSTLVRNSLLLVATLASATVGARSDELTNVGGLVGCLLAVTIGALIVAEAETVETIGGHGNE
jgi:uncharacterized membrane protein